MGTAAAREANSRGDKVTATGESKTVGRMTAMALCLVMAVTCPLAWTATAKQVTGWVQNVALYPGGLIVRAKMDSGAKTSSLHVAHMERFSRDSRPWVRFKVTNTKGHAVVFEQPVVRIVRIKREGGRVEQVPVVMLDICLGPVRKRTQVGLNDRTGFNYQFLVGRRYLAGDFLIDPGRTFLAPPDCKPGG